MPRILVADDDLTTRTILSRVLIDEGYTVETAADGRTALERVVAEPPDLLITDLLMPGLTGWSVFARVRRQAPTLPIIVISGTDMSHRQEALQADRAVFLRKPLELDELLANVAQLLSSAGGRSMG